MIIGIDPGQKGAIAFLHKKQVVAVVDMPVMGRTHGKGFQVDPYALSLLILEHKEGKDATARLEQVSSRPGQSSVAVFNFGEAVGIVKGVLGALQIPVVMVTPQKWKKAAGLTKKDKEASRALAIQLHPEIADKLTRVKDEGRAESILIAHFS